MDFGHRHLQAVGGRTLDRGVNSFVAVRDPVAPAPRESRLVYVTLRAELFENALMVPLECRVQFVEARST